MLLNAFYQEPFPASLRLPPKQYFVPTNDLHYITPRSISFLPLISTNTPTLPLVKPLMYWISSNAILKFLALSGASCIPTLYFAIVQSTLEYGWVVWHPYLAKDQLGLVRIRNKFLPYATFILNIKHHLRDYSLVRNTLKILTLSSKRFDADSNSITSLLNSSIHPPDLLFLISFLVPSHSTKNRQLFPVLTYKNQTIHRILRQASHLDNFY